MQPISFAVPKHAVQQRFRAPKKNIPQTPGERARILHLIRNYVAEHNPVPPMPADELKVHADRLVQMMGVDAVYRDADLALHGLPSILSLSSIASSIITKTFGMQSPQTS